MKRLYRVTVVVEREFDRKATGEAKRLRDGLLRASNEAGWSTVRSPITNRAKPERAPPREREPTDAEVYTSIAKAQALDELQDIAADMAAILGNVKRPRVAWAPNYWCDGRFGRGNDAHSHIENNVRWVRDRSRAGERAGRKIPKGLICLNPRALEWRNSWLSSRDRFVELIAHELMHVRMPGGSHKREKFHAGVEALLTKYRAMKATPDTVRVVVDGEHYLASAPKESRDLTSEGDSTVELGAGDPTESEDDTDG